MVTEQEARDMDAAIKDFETKDDITQRDQDVIDLGIAQSWFDNTIKPTLIWNNAQTDRQQLDNTFTDRNTLEALRPVNRFRVIIVGKEIQNHDIRIRLIKSRL